MSLSSAFGPRPQQLRAHYHFAALLCAGACGCALLAAESSETGGSLSSATGDPNVGAGGEPAGGGPNADIPAKLTYHKDTRRIMAARCNSCHVTDGSAPFPLAQYEHVLAHKAGITEEVKSGRMPPWLPDSSCTKYAGDISLQPSEKQTLLAWLEAGAPEGDPADYKASPEADSGGTLRVDASLKMPMPYKVRRSPDEYRCFVIPWEIDRPRFVTGFNLIPGNPSIVHHAIVDIISPSQAASVRAKDGSDGQPGFYCGQQGASLNWLSAWGPGTLPRAFGDGDSLGTRLEPGSLLVLQMHYHVHTDVASVPPDQSTVQLQLADSVQREGQFVQVLNPIWLAGTMPIPAGAPDVQHAVTVSPSVWYTVAAKKLPASRMGVFMVAAHMHQRGSQANLTILRDGQKKCLLNIPAWDFNWQNGYTLEKPFELMSGDKIQVTCHFDNSAKNQPLQEDGSRPAPRDLNWGEGTDDEMCMGFLYMAPL